MTGDGGMQSDMRPEGDVQSGSGGMALNPQPLAAGAQGRGASKALRVVVVEDDDLIRRQLMEYLGAVRIGGRVLECVEVRSFDSAIGAIRSRRVDLLVLDVFQGKGMEEAGLGILDALQKTGFVCTVLFTAHPERVEGRQSTFVRVVGKEAGGFERLSSEIERLVETRLPDIHRSIAEHVDGVLCRYMWSFVEQRWPDLNPLAATPDFVRLLIHRLAAELPRGGVEELAAEIYGAPPPREISQGYIHPGEALVMPALNAREPSLGDIRRRQAPAGGQFGTEYLVVVWPSCDMTSSGGRAPKTDRVICVGGTPFRDLPDVAQMKTDPSKGKQERLDKVIRNGAEERVHFVPGLCELPDLKLDFQRLEVLPLTAVAELECLGTLASPFAEQLSARFTRYIGRIGVPDVEPAVVFTRLGIGRLE